MCWASHFLKFSVNWEKCAYGWLPDAYGRHTHKSQMQCLLCTDKGKTTRKSSHWFDLSEQQSSAMQFQWWQSSLHNAPIVKSLLNRCKLKLKSTLRICSFPPNTYSPTRRFFSTDRNAFSFSSPIVVVDTDDLLNKIQLFFYSRNSKTFTTWTTIGSSWWFKHKNPIQASTNYPLSKSWINFFSNKLYEIDCDFRLFDVRNTNIPPWILNRITYSGRNRCTSCLDDRSIDIIDDLRGDWSSNAKFDVERSSAPLLPWDTLSSTPISSGVALIVTRKLLVLRFFRSDVSSTSSIDSVTLGRRSDAVWFALM